MQLLSRSTLGHLTPGDLCRQSLLSSATGPQSRSTSVGSTATPEGSCFGRSTEHNTPGALAQHAEPDLFVDTPFVVRNTFIDVRCPPALDGFFQNRQIHSCPVTRPVSFDDLSDCCVAGLLGPDMDDPMELLRNSSMAICNSCERFDTPEPAVSTDSTRPFVQFAHGNQWGCELPIATEPHVVRSWPVPRSFVPAPPVEQAPVLLNNVAQPPPPPAPKQSVAPVVRLAELLAVPREAGPCSLERPSVGSWSHGLGACRPCAFLHTTNGCDNGISCPFCHVCDAGEKKRRQREKRVHKREVNRSSTNHFPSWHTHNSTPSPVAARSASGRLTPLSLSGALAPR